MARCRDCGAEIGFTPTARGKWLPTNRDGSPHPATCPKSPRNQRPPLPEDVCLGCGGSNVERLPGMGPHHGAIRCHDCGSHRWLRRPQETQA